MAERSGERITKKEALERLTAVAGDDPVADLFLHLTSSSLVFRDKTREENTEYAGTPEFRLEAQTYKPGMPVTVEFSITSVKRFPLVPRKVSSLRFVNGRMYGSIHQVGINPHNIPDAEWDSEWEHTTIGPGLVLARHRKEIGAHSRLVEGLYQAVRTPFNGR